MRWVIHGQENRMFPPSSAGRATRMTSYPSASNISHHKPWNSQLELDLRKRRGSYKRYLTCSHKLYGQRGTVPTKPRPHTDLFHLSSRHALASGGFAVAIPDKILPSRDTTVYLTKIDWLYPVWVITSTWPGVIYLYISAPTWHNKNVSVD